MITNKLRLLYRYTEKALTPSIYSHLLQQKLQQSSLYEVMHQLHLYNNQLIVFDYDYYQRCCYRLLDFQKQMNIADLLVALKIGEKHKIKNQLLWHHFQAQIHHKLHKDIMPLFQLQKQQVDNNFKNAMLELDLHSQDFFEILQSPNEFQEVIDQISVNTDNSLTELEKKSKTFQQFKNLKTVKYIDQISEILILYQSDRLQLLKLVLQAQSHPKIRQMTPSSVIKFAETLMYTCQALFKEYDNNKNKYTGRSLKKIYKYQGWYLPDLYRQIADVGPKFKIDELSYLAAVLSSFPIKKRQNRRIITKILSQQLLRRQQNLDDHNEMIQRLLGTDKKLIRDHRLQYKLEQCQQIGS